MKNLMKKLLAVITTLLMFVGLLPASAIAATDATTSSLPVIDTSQNAVLKIKKTDSKLPTPTGLSGAIFDIYKVADLNVRPDTGLSYTPLTPFDTTISADQIKALGTYDAAQLEAMSKALEAKITDATPTTTATTGENGIGIANLGTNNFGLYLVVETQAPEGYTKGHSFLVDVPRTNDAGTAWMYEVTVNAKNASNTATKKIMVDNKLVDINTVGIGDVIKYQIDATLPNFTNAELANNLLTVNIHDKMDEGLALKVDADHPFTVEAANTDGTYESITITAPEDAVSEFDVAITDNKVLEAHKGQALRVTYYATVTDIKAANGKLNHAAIQITDHEDIIPTPPTVYGFAIKVNKTASDTKESLDGVKFELYDNAEDGTIGTKIKEAVATENGTLTFEGLDADAEGTVYWLKETETAAGYSLLTKPVKVTLFPDTDKEGNYLGTLKFKINDGDLTETTIIRTAEADIVNHPGFTLPETGGMGTYLFTIGGIVIMSAAGIILIGMKKKNKA